MPRSNHVGKRFGRLVAVERVAAPRRTRYRCACDCGATAVVDGDRLVCGVTKSCGCLHRETIPPPRTTHGQYGTRTWTTWNSMKTRCLNPAANDYANYGGRGVEVCERWLSFENFLADMGERPAGMTLDRWPDTSGNYEPGNCRWATDVEQQNNRRNNVLIEHEGRTQTVSQWAREHGLNPITVHGRLASGWPIAKALTTPPNPSYQRRKGKK